MNAPTIKALATVALNFLRERTPESCTRLCAFLCCVTGCAAAVATLRFAFDNPGQSTTVAALVGVTSALIAAGCVALLTRSRPIDGSRETVGNCAAGGDS